MKMQITITFEYEANPESYPEGQTPYEMAATDETGLTENPEVLVGMVESASDIRIEIKPKPLG